MIDAWNSNSCHNVNVHLVIINGDMMDKDRRKSDYPCFYHVNASVKNEFTQTVEMHCHINMSLFIKGRVVESNHSAYLSRDAKSSGVPHITSAD